MAKESMRTDQKDITRGKTLVVPEGHEDTVHLHPNDYLSVKSGQIDYSRYTASSLSGGSIIGSPVGSGGDLTDPVEPIIVPVPDVPSGSDIENIAYEQYFDPITKTQKYRAIIKMRNGSFNPTNIAGVDARIYNLDTNIAASKSSMVYNPLTGSSSTPKPTTGSSFVTPTPSTPQVIFKRDGTDLAWGWNNVTGLGSYSAVNFDWIISSTSSPSAATLNSSSLPYSSGKALAIGANGTLKEYRVSTRDGDLAKTSSLRWLRVRARVLATDGNTYYSSYSSPI
jgi:hypothetical protein